MDNWTQSLGAGSLLAIAAGAILLILVMIIRFRVHALLTLVLVSLLTAIVAGLPLEAIVDQVLIKNFGGTLGSVAILVGLGAMLGRLVETSGGAQSLADALVRLFGEKRAAFALGVASLIFGFPIFFDAGLVVMLPIVFATARRMNEPVLPYGLASIGAFSVMHVFLPPHPGPIAAGEYYGANIGHVLLLGLPIAVITWYFSGYLLGQFLGRHFHVPVPDFLSGGKRDTDTPRAPASAGTVIGIMLIPMVLIFLNTGLMTLISQKVVSADATWVKLLRMLGATPIALLISVLVALFVLGRKRGEHASALEKTVDGALGPVCSVILITGAGGMFGGVLRASGIGKALADGMAHMGISVIAGCFLVALVLRVAQGSATVALTTAAALMAPAVASAGYNDWQLAAIVLATASGSVFASHVNDSGFWLVGRLLDMDVPTTLKTWTVNQALIAVIGFALSALAFSLL
ncbi:GntP family permease [Cardiobacterium valvarum]|uniref:Inner membrane permease ygbN n=2 Tax=Cardiobacterium valvarum TaxID=194702 RepID=A0A381DX50_9GAMM|nr:GntP family permease [Cardiobacterium valvarum]EHM54548.1 transporter, gluconate:H+ symporter family [Cardiobacterium valvarum F0432]SUX17619.1 Inner membrane permease ygbN [Cardiobacterium valvarum]